jgi:hypothetical protein
MVFLFYFFANNIHINNGDWIITSCAGKVPGDTPGFKVVCRTILIGDLSKLTPFETSISSSSVRSIVTVLSSLIGTAGGTDLIGSSFVIRGFC